MKNKANVLAAALAGIGFWAGAIYLFSSAPPAPQKPITKADSQKTTPEIKPKEKPRKPITSFAQAEATCPNDRKCIRQGLVADFGRICKSWVKLETDMHYTASSEGRPERVFHSTDRVTKNRWRLLGDAFYDTGTGVRYWYGCEVNTSTGKITGIAPPVPVGTKRRYKAYN